MAFHTEAWLWCALQTSLVASLGVVAVAWLQRRTPASAAAVGATAAVAVLALTVVAPVRLPKLFAVAPVGPVESVAAGAVGTATGRPVAAAPRVSSGDRGLDVLAAMRALGRTLRIDNAPQPRSGFNVTWTAMMVAAVGASFGLMRLAASLACVWRLDRRCTQVQDARLTQLIDRLSVRLGVRRRVALGESTDVFSPAVIGWRRPRILLPSAWRRWTDDQLRAALAHELAHVARMDFTWRLTASVVRAVHVLNPMVHLLAQRLTLAQELAADRMAAAEAGGAANYARTLASMALALDGRRRTGTEPILLPVFSSNLTRRMTMLRSTDGSETGGGRLAAGRLCAGLIVLAALGGTALRSLAEAPGGEPAAKLVERKPFSLAAPDLSFFGPVDIGMLVVQTDELAGMKELATACTMAETFVQDQLDAMKLTGAATPKVRLEAIDYIAFAMRRVSAEEIAKNSVLVPGADNAEAAMSELAIRWVEATDVVKWVADHVPEAERMVDDGLRYVRLKMGDEPGAAYYIAQRDPRTVVASYSAERLRALVSGTSATAPSERQVSVAGGLATMWFNARFEPGALAELWAGPPLWVFGAGETVEKPDPFAAARETIVKATGEICVGLDVTGGEGNLNCRLALACGDEASAKRVLESVRLIQEAPRAIAKLWKEQLTAPSEELSSLDATQRALVDGRMLGMELLADASLEVRQRGDDGADVWMETTGQLPGSLRDVMNGTGGGWITVTPVGTTSSVDEDVALVFSAPTPPAPLDPSLLGGGGKGLFVLRLSELARRPAFAPVIQLANRMIRRDIQEFQGVIADAVPELHFEQIEYIAGDCSLRIRPKAGDEPSQRGEVMVASQGVAVRFCGEAPTLDRIQAVFEGATLGVQGDSQYLTLPPVVPAFGPEQLCVAVRDRRTLVVALGKDNLAKFMSPQQVSMAPGAADSWRAVQGRLAGMIADVKVLEVNGEPAAEPPTMAMVNRLIAGTERLDAAFDLDPVTNRAELRLGIHRGDRASADAALETVNELVAGLQPLLQAMIDSPPVEVYDGAEREKMNLTAGGPDTDRQVGQFWMEVLRGCSAAVAEYDDGSASVTVTATPQFPRSILRAYEMAEAAGKNEGFRPR